MEKFLSLIDHYNSIVNGIVWGTPMLILLIGVGIFYTIRIKGFQITHAKEVYENTVKGIFGGSKGKKNKNVLSQFQALSTALASNNAKTYLYEPNDGKEYIQIYSCGNTYYVEKLDDSELTSDACFFGNVLKVKANPIYHTNKEILIGDDDNPVIDSIHIENINGVSLVTLAVSNKLSHWAGKILAIAVTLFAFTTILGWSYYGSQTIGYIFGKISIYIYKVFYILFIIVGSVMSLNLVWNITDTFNALMAIPNLIGLLLLSGTVIKIVKNYYARQRGKKVAPMISFHKMK